MRSFRQKERDAIDSIGSKKYCNVGVAIGAAVGAVGASVLGGGPDVPDPNPGMKASAAASMEVAKIQAETAKEYLDFTKQQYSDLKPMLDQIYGSQISLMNQQSDILKSNAARASEYADYERNTFRPLEQRLVQEAKDYDTDAKREEKAQEAIADVRAAYDTQRESAMREMARYGINPNSNRFAAINSRLSMAEAGDSAGAATKARRDAETISYARKLDAASLGRGLASNASTAATVATSAGAAANTAGNSAVNTALAAPSYMGTGYQQAGNLYGDASRSYGIAGNIYGQEFDARMRGYAAESQAQSALLSGLGQAAGTFGYAYGKKAGWFDPKTPKPQN